MTSLSNAANNLEIRAPHADDRFPADVPPPQPDEDAPRWRRSQVAVVDGQVVGAASVALSPVTDSYFCEVDVTSPYRRQGIGTRLYAAVYATTNPHFSVLARAMRSQPQRREFADSLGCSVMIQCPAPWVDPTSQPAQQWIADQKLPAGHVTVTMDDLPVEQVAAAWATYYDWGHQPFGTVHAERIPDMWDSYSQGVDPHLSMLSLDRNSDEIVAFSLVTPDAWDGRTMIVAETVKQSQLNGVELLKATVAASLRALAQRGAHRVEMEGHTTDPHLPGLVASLPPAGGDPMDILKLAAPRD